MSENVLLYMGNAFCGIKDHCFRTLKTNSEFGNFGY